jgi:hypothetical protein
VGVTYRALNNNEWKAATVLGGATIEALLHWRLGQPKPTPAEIATAVSNLRTKNPKFRAPRSLDDWDLGHFIPVAEELKLNKPSTAKAADLARDLRNLIHPGAGVRKNALCDKATAHVIRSSRPSKGSQCTTSTIRRLLPVVTLSTTQASLLLQHQGEERAEHMAADSGVAGMIDRAGARIALARRNRSSTCSRSR